MLGAGTFYNRSSGSALALPWLSLSSARGELSTDSQFNRDSSGYLALPRAITGELCLATRMLSPLLSLTM